MLQYQNKNSIGECTNVTQEDHYKHDHSICFFICFMLSGLLLSLLLLFLLWLSALCLVSSSFVFRSCGFFFCLLLCLLLLFLFRFSAFVLCGFCLWLSGLPLCLLSSLSSSVLSSSLVFCFRFFYLSSVYCFVYLSSVFFLLFLSSLLA